MLLLCRQQHVIISPGEKCLTPPWQGNSFTNLMMWSTIQTTIMPGTAMNGKLWQSKQIFSFKKRMLCLMSPQCCDAAAQFKQGAVGRAVVNALSAENSWSPEIIVIWKSWHRYMLYVTRRASQIYFSQGIPNEWPRRSRSLCYKLWRRCVCWQKKHQSLIWHLNGAWWALWEPWYGFALPSCCSSSLCYPSPWGRSIPKSLLQPSHPRV